MPGASARALARIGIEDSEVITESGSESTIKNARKRDYISSFPVGAAWANMILTIFMKMLRKNMIWKHRRNF